LKNPFKFESSLRKVMTPYGFDNEPFAHVILPKPVFRYSVLFRQSYLAKLELKAETLGSNHELSRSKKMRDYVLNNTNSKNFGQKMYEYERSIPHAYSPGFLFKPIKLGLEDHPKIMQGLFNGNTSDYHIRKDLLK
jgi:hypothetical protein